VSRAEYLQRYLTRVCDIPNTEGVTKALLEDLPIKKVAVETQVPKSVGPDERAPAAEPGRARGLQPDARAPAGGGRRL
jgi:hypothetical protein